VQVKSNREAGGGNFGRRQLRQITPSIVLRWQNDLEGKLSHSGVMACRSILLRILEAARRERLIPTNPVRDVDAPKPPINPEQIFGHERRRTFTPEEFGRFLAACRPFYRDHFLTQVGTGLRSGELLGLRRRRVFPELRRIEVLEVRYEAGQFGRGFKPEPKSPASVRVVPMCEQVREAILRQLPAGARPDDLVFTGPGGSNGVRRGARPPLSTGNLRRVFKAAVSAAGQDLAHLDLRGPHDLRHTFATWLEDAGIPSRVIDELMGHSGGRRDRGSAGSPMGRVYRERRRRCWPASPSRWTNGSVRRWRLLRSGFVARGDQETLRRDEWESAVWTTGGLPRGLPSRVPLRSPQEWNRRPHPQLKILGRGDKLPGTYQGRRGPRPLRRAVNGPGAMLCCPSSSVRGGRRP
jgi:integrase